MSYCAIVAKIKVRPHPNADKLKIGTVCGSDCIVGIDVEDGELGVFFPDGGQLSLEFLEKNNLLYRNDKDGKRIDGYFGPSRRVRAMSLRGIKSYGFWTRCASLCYTGQDVSTLGEGYEFSALNGHDICNKYITPQTLRSIHNKQIQGKSCKSISFPEHFDTKQLKHQLDPLPESKTLYITEKLHGTSGRYGYVKVKNPISLSWWKKLINREVNLYPTSSEAYEYVNGSRRVNLYQSLTDSYYKDGFRFNLTKPLEGKLKKGEIIYFEIVGWVNESTPIMSCVNTKKLGHDARTRYGDNMIFSYGNEAGKNHIRVYRIAYTNDDGEQVDLAYPQMVERCCDLGIKSVPLLDTILSSELGSYNELVKHCDKILEKNNGSTLDKRHLMEGVCITWYDAGKCITLKHKSFDFLLAEGIVKDDESSVDMEEST